MLFLELAFTHDTTTKVKVRPNLGNAFRVVGVTTTNGKMVEEFYRHLRREALPYARTLEEFRSYLNENYDVLPKRLSQHNRLSTWLEQISVSLSPARNTSGTLLGREVLLSRDDAPGSWIWKDYIESVDVLLP